MKRSRLARSWQTFMWDFLIPLNESDMIECSDVRWQTSVHTENLTVYQGRNGQHVKHPAAVSPGVGVPVFVLALVVKAVHLQSVEPHIAGVNFN